MSIFSELSFLDSYQHIGIVYEDNHLLVVHKPRNIAVQADSTGDESLQEKLQHFLKQKYDKPGNVFLGIVHRLDRPVSGLMVFAKTSKAASRLSEQIRNRSFKKTYLVAVEGILPEHEILEDYLLKQEKENRVLIVSKSTSGSQWAKLTYHRIHSDGKTSWAEVDLETGRPHQIRVQFSSRGFPIIGDGKYGSKNQKSSQIELKSAGLAFEHPTTKEQLDFRGIISDSKWWKVFL